MEKFQSTHESEDCGCTAEDVFRCVHCGRTFGHCLAASAEVEAWFARGVLRSLDNGVCASCERSFSVETRKQIADWAKTERRYGALRPRHPRRPLPESAE